MLLFPLDQLWCRAGKRPSHVVLEKNCSTVMPIERAMPAIILIDTVRLGR